MRKGSNGVVACVHPRAAEEGAKVLEAGGNAFDAAIATAFTQMVVTPFSCGVGGMVSAHVWSAEKREHLIIDGLMRAGSQVSEDMWADDHLGEANLSGSSLFEDNRSALGYTSICTPGAVAGFAEMHRRYASMPWAELLQPAIRIARNGFVVTPELSKLYLPEKPQPYEPDSLTRLKATTDCAKIYLKPDGGLMEKGDVIQNPDYADTLDRLATNGPRDFYDGDLAGQIVDDLHSNGAFVTREDLREYQTTTYAPPSGRYGPYEIFSDGPPGGGPLLIEALNTLDGIGLEKMTHGEVDYIATMASTLQLVNQDRRDYLGDPEFIGDEPGNVLLSRERADILREAVRNGGVGGELPPQEDNDTTQLTVDDNDANIASITHSLGNFSGVVTSGLGFVYNNGMNRFDPRPGRASSFAPRKARLHLMMPAIAFKDGEPMMAFGAPGGNSILGGLIQVFTSIVGLGMTALEATVAPRIYAEGSTVWVEARTRTDVCDALTARGYEVVQDAGSFSRGPLVQVVVIGEDGKLDAASDPRGSYGLAYAREQDSWATSAGQSWPCLHMASRPCS